MKVYEGFHARHVCLSMPGKAVAGLRTLSPNDMGGHKLCLDTCTIDREAMQGQAREALYDRRHRDRYTCIRPIDVECIRSEMHALQRNSTLKIAILINTGHNIAIPMNSNTATHANAPKGTIRKKWCHVWHIPI